MILEKQPVVIVGSGLAGYTVAREFRKLDADTPVLIITRDHGGFYSKPMLSNALAQKKTADSLLMKDAARMAHEIGVEVRNNATVTDIDPSSKHIVMNGEQIHYSKLVLALGADTIKLPLQGSGAAEVISVNDLDDYRNFRAAIDGKKKVTILGAGLIGCEFANDLAIAGYQIDVIDLAPQVLGRLLPSEAAGFIQSRLQAEGVNFHLGCTTQSIERKGQHLQVELSDGSVFETDVVLSAVGLKPRIALAQAAGIKINRGIVVDANLQSSAPDIYALGDCAEVEGRVLPFVMPIMTAARALAPTLTGKITEVHYPTMPVAVKTPACPTVVAPAEPGAQGDWKVETCKDGVKAVFRHQNGNLLGYALLGSYTSEKSGLTSQLPMVS